MLGMGLKSFLYLAMKVHLSSMSFQLRSTFYPIANACQAYERSLWNRSWNTWVTFLIAWPERISVSAWEKWRFMWSKGIIFSQVEWACTCSGIDSSPQTLTCEKMFEHPKARAVTGPQTPNTGQQVLPQCIHLTETLNPSFWWFFQGN